MPIDPQFSETLAMMKAMPSLADIPMAMLRKPIPPNPNLTPVASVEDRTIAGPGGPLKLRIYRASEAQNLPLLVFMHGGGFVVGSITTHDEMARVLTVETGAVTVSVDYRLAPEHPFPAAPDDSYAALKWAAAHAKEIGADPARIAVVGDSAGGNLAAVMALRARDESGPALRAQALIYPGVEMGVPLPPGPDGEYHIVSLKDSEFYYRSYMGDGAQNRNPYASPLLAQSHKGLPPALVITAEYDSLCQQGEAYAAKLKAAGVETEHKRYEGAIHGFVSFPGPMGKDGLSQVSAWLKKRLA